jgi:uncharacterized protein
MVWILPIFALLVGLYASIGYTIAHRLTKAKRRTSPEHVRQYLEIDFVARGDNLALKGCLARSQQPSNRVLILVHGRNACKGWEFNASSQGLVQQMLHHGFDVLMFDLRGHGQSATSRLTFGLHEHKDVLGAVDFLRSRGYKSGQIGVLGLSVGAVCGLLAASREPAIGAVIADSGFADFGTIIRHQFKHLSGLPDFFLAGGLLAGQLLTGERLQRFKPLESLSPCTPTLVIHADKDDFIPSTQAALLASATSAELWQSSGESHLAVYRNSPEAYATRVLAFLELHLPVSQPTPTVGQPVLGAV